MDSSPSTEREEKELNACPSQACLETLQELLGAHKGLWGAHSEQSPGKAGCGFQAASAMGLERGIGCSQEEPGKHSSGEEQTGKERANAYS